MILFASSFDGLMQALWLSWVVAVSLGLFSLFLGWKRSRWLLSGCIIVVCSVYLGWMAHDAKVSFGADNAFFWACASVSGGLACSWVVLRLVSRTQKKTGALR